MMFGKTIRIEVPAKLADVRRELIEATLEYCFGDKKRAAEYLGISLRTVHRFCEKGRK